jgi:ribonucleoside-diphosphate reductase alpha chain
MSMARRDATTGTTTQHQTPSSGPDAAAIVLNEAVTDLALDCRDYYGDNELAADVLRSKYLAPNEQGPMHMWNRIAKAVASVEKDKHEYWHKRFLEILFDFTFVPGGRVMHGAGREDARRRPTLSNCYVVPILEDSLEGIYRCISESAMVYRTGGGVGTDLSALRPEGAPVNATIDHSPGATAFMNLFSESTNTVSQAGRRGALMLTMRIDHPDIEHFITIKNDPRRLKVQYANISVLITHEFMQAVSADQPFPLRWGGKTYRTMNARELWHKIIKNAHASAEPGIIFWDTMRDYHNVEYANPLVSTNPCGEQPLAAYTACNLGSINLSKFVDTDGQFNYGRLSEVTRTATRFMDDIIDYNMDNHALEKIKKAVASDRRIGLGITGLADALVLMNIRYDSQEALDAVDSMMKTIRDEAYRTSIALAREKGAFPLFEWEGFSRSKFVASLPVDIREEIKKHGIRNSTVITVPPVGTGSIVAQTSSGIEPIFCTSYRRRVKNHDGESFSEYKVYHPLVKKLYGDDVNLPPYIVTAHDIDPFFRVKMQGVIQKYVDSSISSTVNLAENVTIDTVADIYMAAYRAGLKGITVYREGSREGILQTEEYAKKQSAAIPKSEHRHVKGPRQRPTRTTGVTERVKTGEGYLYVTINEDEEGLCEVFTTIGKAGGNAAAQSEAISRLISLSLRSGVQPREIVKQLKGISGPTPVWDGQGGQVFSTPDAIAKVLERYLEHREETRTVRHVRSAATGNPSSHTPVSSNQQALNMACPECGSNVEHVTGCVVCYNCGWSKC